MAHFVLDSFALLAFFRNEPGGEFVEELLNGASAGKHELYLSCINAGEVFYMTCRKENTAKAEIIWKALMEFPINIIDADLELALSAAKLKATHKMSYADAFAAALTKKKKGTLITGDKEFKVMEGEVNFKVRFI